MKILNLSLAIVCLLSLAYGKKSILDGEKTRTPEQQAFIDSVNASTNVSVTGGARSAQATADFNLQNDTQLEFALNQVFMTGDRGLNKACFLVMKEKKGEVFYCFQERISSGIPLEGREKSSFLAWGRSSSDKHIFNYVIDEFIDDKEQTPRISRNFGKPLRYCDIAYMNAFTTIAGTRRWSENGKISPLDKMESRDQKVALFQEWWNGNKTNLMWSAESEEFFIPTEKEIGEGIISGKSKYDTAKPIKTPQVKAMEEARKAKKAMKQED